MGLGLKVSPNEPLETLQVCSLFDADCLASHHHLEMVTGLRFLSSFFYLGEMGKNKGRLSGCSQGQRKIRKPRLCVPAWQSCVSLKWCGCLLAMGQQCLPHLQSAKHIVGAGHRCTLAPLCLQALCAHK